MYHLIPTRTLWSQNHYHLHFSPWMNCLLPCLVPKSCPTLCDPMDCSLPGSSVHRILQARILECVVIPSPGESSRLRDWTLISWISRRILYDWATREALSHVSIQFGSVTQSCSTLCDPMDCSTPGFPVHHQLPEFTQTHVHWNSDAIQPSHPLSSPSPPAFNLSQHQGLFQWVSSLHQVANVLEFQLPHQSFQEYSVLISFGMDWLDLLAVQGTLKSLLQHHSSKASFFSTQLSL